MSKKIMLIRSEELAKVGYSYASKVLMEGTYYFWQVPARLIKTEKYV